MEIPNRSFADLQAMQRLPLEAKVLTTQARIYDWIDKWGVDGVYVAFSGGKDSTVLLHLVREIALDVAAVFVDTGLEYPEVKRFAKSFDNITVLRPKMRFDEVIKKYGYPLISKEVSECVSQVRRFVQGTTRGVFVSRKSTRYQQDRYCRISGTGRYANRKGAGDADEGQQDSGEYPQQPRQK